jgi:hypothetical protein
VSTSGIIIGISLCFPLVIVSFNVRENFVVRRNLEYKTSCFGESGTFWDGIVGNCISHNVMKLRKRGDGEGKGKRVRIEDTSKSE